MPINHGAAASPDGRWLYFSSEAEQTLHVVDGKTLQTTKKIPLTGRPNNISIGKDGRRVYVGIVSAPGAVDVIDTASLEQREDRSRPRAASTTSTSRRTASTSWPARLPAG